MTPNARARAFDYWPAAAIFLLTLCLFWNAIHNDFLYWDDDLNFLRNPWYRGLGAEQLRWMWTSAHSGHYIPLTWMTLGLDYTLWGMNPKGYHLTNVLLHSANAAVFFFVVRRLAAPFWPAREAAGMAAFAAIFFALHPLRVESVAWVTERRDVLSGFFYLGSILFYLKAGERKGWMTGSFLCFLAALLSKSIVMTLPAVLVILDFFPLGRISTAHFKRDLLASVWRKRWFFLASLAAAYLSLLIVQNFGWTISYEKLGPGLRVVQVLYAFAFYIEKTFLPFHLSPLYQFPPVEELATIRYWGRGLVFVAVLAGSLFWARNKKAAGAFWAFFLVTILPVSGVVHIGPQIVADRYSYLACLGWAVLAGLGISFVMKGLPRRAATACVLAALAALTARQIYVWRDTESFWTYVLKRNPSSYTALTSLGLYRVDNGAPDEGFALLQKAVEINPQSSSAFHNLGFALEKMGKAQAAIPYYLRAIELNPGLAQAHNNLGHIYLRAKDKEQSLAHFAQALTLRPGMLSAERGKAQAEGLP